jgi:hypothetical protein
MYFGATKLYCLYLAKAFDATDFLSSPSVEIVCTVSKKKKKMAYDKKYAIISVKGLNLS